MDTGERRGWSYEHRREARTELRTSARGVDGAADATEGDPERQATGGGDAGGGADGCETTRESSGSWKCVVRLQLPLGHSLTPLFLTLMGQLKVGRIL